MRIIVKIIFIFLYVFSFLEKMEISERRKAITEIIKSWPPKLWIG